MCWMGVHRCWGTLPWQPIWDAMCYNWLWRLMGYNFGCTIASDTLFDSRGWVFWIKLSEENIVEIECLRVVAMATNFGTKIALTGIVRTTATRQLVMEGVWVVGRQNADTADILHTGDVAMASIIWLSVHIQCTLAPPGEYKWTVRVWRRCGLMSNYFDHLLYFLGKNHHLTAESIPTLCLLSKTFHFKVFNLSRNNFRTVGQLNMNWKQYALLMSKDTDTCSVSV